MLGITLLLGAIGLPLPAALVGVAAGALVAQGKLEPVAAVAVAVAASAIGDLVGYGLGRWAGESFLARWGGWIGDTPARRARLAGLLNRYDVPTLLISRTLMSGLGSVVNVLAGIGRHRLGRFATLTVAGRLLWTSAYLGLGYLVGGELEAATRFLQNLAALLVALGVLAGSALAYLRRSAA